MKADKRLDLMRDNPRDWSISDVEAICRAYGVTCIPPRRGSHYKVTHADSPAILTIPADRPIKPVYIRRLVKLIDDLLENGDG